MDYLTAGESHGPMLTGILTGMPANVPIDIPAIDRQLALRQNGYGRGGRMRIEHDTVTVTAGVRAGQTTGSPIGLLIKNRDYSHWQDIIGAAATNPDHLREVTRPRPGHADLVGGLKYDQQDLRNILERASARSTAMMVALGTVTGQLLNTLGIHALGYVTAMGGHRLAAAPVPVDVAGLTAIVEGNDLRLRTTISWRPSMPSWTPPRPRITRLADSSPSGSTVSSRGSGPCRTGGNAWTAGSQEHSSAFRPLKR